MLFCYQWLGYLLKFTLKNLVALGKNYDN